MNNLTYIILLGVGATALMDAWSIARKSLFGTPLPNYGMVGRWIAHMALGRFRHEAIAKSSPMHGEHVIGWVSHYLIGITFATLLVAICGNSWIENPTFSPALAVGIGTVAAPFLLMQPGMGAGIAASKTPKPNTARLQSLVTHAVFGLGLYAAGCLVNFFNSI